MFNFFLSEKIKLEDAIRLSYENFENNLVRDVIYCLSIEQIPFYFIYDFLEFGVNFYGINSVFNVREIISPYYLKRGNFQKEGHYNFYHSCRSNDLYYRDITVECKQVNKYIKSRKNEYKNLNEIDFENDEIQIEIE